MYMVSFVIPILAKNMTDDEIVLFDQTKYIYRSVKCYRLKFMVLQYE